MIKKIGMQLRLNNELNILDIFIAQIVFSSIIAIIMLVLKVYNPVTSLIIGGILNITFINICQIKISLCIPNLNWIIIIILLFSIILRIPSSLIYLGGSDEGVYTNMAVAYEKYGSNFVVDGTREKLNDSEKSYYDGLNNKINQPYILQGEFEGNHLPGMEIKDISKSEYVFQFYPLHPIWMNIGSKLVGDNSEGFSTLIFAILSIFFFYLLAIEITKGNKTAGYIIALLLSVSPLHIFFSKFTTAELMVLSFSSISFYYLLRYINNKGNNLMLFLSWGSMYCLFFTHLRGFLYVPIFLIFIVINLLFNTNESSKKKLNIYFVSVNITFLLSQTYGFFNTYPYFAAIMRRSFPGLENRYFILNIYAFIIALIIICFIIAHFKKLGEKIVLFLDSKKNYIIYFIILSGFFTAILLAYTDTYANHSVYNWLSNNGLESLKLSTISYLMVYLTPIGFIVFIYAIYIYSKEKDINYRLYFVVIGILWSSLIIFYPGLPDYIRARYLIVETIPYSLLLISICVVHITNKKNKYLGMFIISSMVIYLFVLSLPQYRFNHLDTSNLKLGEVMNGIDDNDFILYSSDFDNRLEMPLRYYYDKNLSNYDVLEETILNFKYSIVNTFGDVYILSKDPLVLPYLDLYKTTSYVLDVFTSGMVPIEHGEYGISKLYFYRLSKEKLANIDGVLVSDYSWTDGDEIFSDQNYKVKDKDEFLVITSIGQYPNKDNISKLNLEVLVNGYQLEYIKTDGNDFYFKLNENISIISEISVKSNTFIPAEIITDSNDTRSLGVDIQKLMIK